MLSLLVKLGDFFPIDIQTIHSFVTWKCYKAIDITYNHSIPWYLAIEFCYMYKSFLMFLSKLASYVVNCVSL